nr:unnamed protein product [Callosobruchus analis]
MVQSHGCFSKKHWAKMINAEAYTSFYFNKTASFVYVESRYQSLKKDAEYFRDFYHLEESPGKSTYDFTYGQENKCFLSTTRQALLILITIPCTTASTATVERSFNPLQRVKTWLRSTLGEEMLTGLCLFNCIKI